MNVLGLPIKEGYELPFIFTLVILLVKFILIIFLATRIAKQRKQENAVAIAFLAGILFLVITLFISRIFYLIFDFVLTNFDMTTYAYFPNIWYWKTGSILSSFGIGVLLIIIDKKVMQFKFKGLFGIIVFITSCLQFFWPVNNIDDFTIVSDIGTIGGLCAFFIPILFFWIGAKTPGLRKTSFSVAFGTIIYVVGGAVVGATFINIFGLPPYVMYAMSTILKTIALLMITYGAIHFAT